MKWKYIISLGFINFIYIIVGGCIFHLIEYPEEEQKNRQAIDNYIAIKKELLQNITCMNQQDLETFIEYIINQYDNGKILPITTATPDWSISKSIFFATTVITTIGYGNTSLDTDGGKIFCVFYAFFGIPLCLTLLGGIGKRLNKFGKSLDAKLNRGIFKPTVGRSVRATILFVIGFALFIVVPAIILTFLEGWGYGIALYYGFITLTTIGFGDYVAGQNEDQDYGWLYTISLAVWIMIGLAWAAAMIANVQELYKGIAHPDLSKEEDEEEQETLQENTVSTKEDIPLVKDIPIMTNYTGEQIKQVHGVNSH